MIVSMGILVCAALLVGLWVTALRHLERSPLLGRRDGETSPGSKRPDAPQRDLDPFLQLVEALAEVIPGGMTAEGDAPDSPRALAIDLLERLGRSPAEIDALRARLDQAASLQATGRPPRAAVERLRRLLLQASASKPAAETAEGSSENRLLFVSFEQEIRAAERRGAPLTLVDLRLEGFDTFEDRFGRAATDRILRGVARAIRSQLRPADTCVRDAGGAFLVLLPGLAAEAVQALAARIEAAVTRHKFALERGRSVTVEATLCAATFPQDGRSYDALLTAVRTRRALDRRGGAAGSQATGPYQPYPHRIDAPVN